VGVVAAGAVPIAPPAGAPPNVDVGAGAPVGEGLVVGVVMVEGVTAVPEAESASPRAETPRGGAVGPMAGGVEGAAATAEVAVMSGPVDAAGVPVGVGVLAGDVAEGVPVGVRMSDVAVVGAGFAVVTDLAAPAAVLPAAGAAREKLLEPRPPPV
jgi:hypothetical protein